MTSGVYDGFMYPYFLGLSTFHGEDGGTISQLPLAQAEGLLRKVKDVLVFLLSNTLLFVVSPGDLSASKWKCFSQKWL